MMRVEWSEFCIACDFAAQTYTLTRGEGHPMLERLRDRIPWIPLAGYGCLFGALFAIVFLALLPLIVR